MKNREIVLEKFIRKFSYLDWYVNNPKDSNDSPVEIATECVLSNGSWDDMQSLIKIISVKKMATTFRQNINGKWKPYFRPIATHYLTLYFNRYAPLSK